MRTRIKSTVLKVFGFIGHEPRRLWALYAFILLASAGLAIITHFSALDAENGRSGSTLAVTQTTLLSATILILLAEAFFVFCPAIFALQQKDLALMRSRRRLLLLTNARKQSTSLNQQTGLPNRKALETYLSEITCGRRISGLDARSSFSEATRRVGRIQQCPP